MNPEQTFNQGGVSGQPGVSGQFGMPGQPGIGQPAGFVAMPGQPAPTQSSLNQSAPSQALTQSFSGQAQTTPIQAQARPTPIQAQAQAVLSQTQPVSNQFQPTPGQAQSIPNQTQPTPNQTQPAQPTRKDNPNSTQSTLLISELRDNVVIMKDGSFRAVIACKSINFDLMSDAEREGVEYSYRDFLNSLNFTTQILVRSQRVDIGPYLDRLVDIRRHNDNMLLGVLMDNYIEFVDALAQEANIMDKLFFVIVPYYSSPDVEQGMQQTKNFFKTFARNKTPEVTRIDRATYDKAMGELNNRVETVLLGLYEIGIQAVRLKTKELAELYYNYNNPDTAVREPLVDFSRLATLYVAKDETNEQTPGGKI